MQRAARTASLSRGFYPRADGPLNDCPMQRAERTASLANSLWFIARVVHGRNLSCCKYNSSTFFRAQGVRRKKTRLDFTFGSIVKQRTGTAAPIASQPMVWLSCVTIASSVMPSSAAELRFAGFEVIGLASGQSANFTACATLTLTMLFLLLQVRIMTESVRLAKTVVDMASCSRREAELYIEGGWVTVDGQVVQEPQFRVSGQKVVLHPEATLTPVELVTILYHHTPLAGAASNLLPLINIENRASVDDSGIRPLKRHFARLAPTLPLEPGASGLLVLTQDWRVLRKLVDDAATVEQEYIVIVGGQTGLAAHGLKQLNHGLSFNGRALAPAKVSWQNETRLRFALKGVQPGQIAHACQCVGLSLESMKRIRIGKISMGKMPAGQWQYLPPGERF
jgi:23S rRNA pseudouridine2604 synthase